MPQLNAEVTDAVKQKVGQLEMDLLALGAKDREIVAVLIERAKASDISASALGGYRIAFAEEKRRRQEAGG